MKRFSYFILILFIFSNVVFSQDEESDYEYENDKKFRIPSLFGEDFYDIDECDCSNKSFDIPSSSFGLSFGNSRNFTGLRFNTRECNIGTINGINITLWTPKNPGISSVNGFSFGVAPAAEELNGIQLGMIGSVSGQDMNGINFGGLAIVSGEDMNGINIGFLAAVSNNNMNGFNFGSLATISNNDMNGINIGGLATVSNGSIAGLNFGGLALVSNNNMTGINFSSLATVAQGKLTGLNFSGLALVSQDDIFGINFSGAALVSQKDIGGINISGIALVSNGELKGLNLGLGAIVSGEGNITGINVGLGAINAVNDVIGLTFNGYKTECTHLKGINVTIGWSDLEELSGISISSLNKISGHQTGISIGLFNIAESLSGLQLGLINIVKDNPIPFRILPGLNVGF